MKPQPLFIRGRGFTLVELVGAIVIIGILVGIVAITAGTSRDLAIETRVKADIEAINGAKGLWSLDHNGGGAAFNALSETERFAAIAKYLSLERTYSNMADFAQGSGHSYHINNLGQSASP